MQSGDSLHGGSERDGDRDSDGGSSQTDYPSEDDEVQVLLLGLLAPPASSNGAVQGGTATLIIPPTSSASAERSPSPGFQSVLARLGLSASDASLANIYTCEAALEAPDGAFGEYSEDVRIFAGDALHARRSGKRAAAAAAPPGAYLAQPGCPVTVPGPIGASSGTSTACLTTSISTATTAASTTTSIVPAARAAPPSGLEQANAARVSVAAAAALVSAANLAPEERAIELAIDQFLALTPVELLFPTSSALQGHGGTFWRLL